MRGKMEALRGIVLATAATSCGVLFSLDGYTEDGATTDAALADVGALDAATCTPTRPPVRTASSAADVAGDTVFALDALDFVDPTRSARGYDLDGRCTVDIASSVCKAPDGRELVHDLAGGVDNAAYPIFALAALRPRTRIDRGAYGVVVVIRRWNGTPDDPAVEIALYNSPGARAPLAKDGTDTLPIVNELGAGAVAVPAYRADESRGYVAGGVLVASLSPERFDDGPAIDDNFAHAGILLDRLRVPFESAILSARIEGSGTAAKLVDGTIAGVVFPDELLASLPFVPDPSGASVDGGTAYVCAETAAFREARDKICGRTDTTTEDLASELCDYTSAVMAFSGTSARLGATVAPAWSTSCPRDGTSLPYETCP